MRWQCIVCVVVLLAPVASYGAVVDLSNGGANWTVPLGGSVTVPVFLTNDANDAPKYSVDLELSLSVAGDPGGATLPTIQSIDLLAGGAIFSGGTQYPMPGQGIGTANAFRSADLNGGTTAAEGLLANLVIDLADVSPGIYTLAAISEGAGAYTGTKLWDAGFNEIPLNFTVGTITIIPEPSTWVLGGIGALSLLVVRRRRRR